jgi:hypothetical protein
VHRAQQFAVAAIEPVQHRNACIGLTFNLIKHCCRGPTRVNAHDSSAGLGHQPEQFSKHLLLQTKTAAVTSRAIQADLANVAGLWK